MKHDTARPTTRHDTMGGGAMPAAAAAAQEAVGEENSGW